MRRMAMIAGMCMLASIASAQGGLRSYWLLSEDQGHTWCGYTDPDGFQSASVKLKPTEVAIVTYSLGTLTTLIHQVNAESGDWAVVDRYTSSKDGLLLQRQSLLTQQNLQVTQSAVVSAGRATPLRVVSVTPLRGQKADTAAHFDLPDVPVITNVFAAPFMLVVTEMRHESVPKVCRKVQ